MKKSPYKILLADDDYLVRSYLKSLPVWEKAGCQITGDVRDGEEALEVLARDETDILITDITMPLMDGIELIRRIREKDKRLYIIVLSCHDEFPFVKEAMKLGADEYLLKNSLQEETLLEVLQTVREQIASREKESGEEEKRTKLMEMGSQALKFQFFNQLLSGALPHEIREERRKEAGIRGCFRHSAVITITIKNWQEWKEEKTEAELEYRTSVILKELNKRFQTVMEECEVCLEVIDLGTGIFCCFLDLSETNRSSLMRQWMTNSASVCCRFVEEQKKMGETADFGIALSSICIGEDGLRQAFFQAREVMKQSFYNQDGVLQYEHISPLCEQLPSAAALCLRQAKSGWEILERPERQSLVQDAARSMEEERTDIRIVIQWIKDMDQQLGISRDQEVYGNLYSFLKVKKLAESYLESRTEENCWPAPAKTGMVVLRALDFMKENFGNQIGLTETAEAAGVNSAYLSYLFKQEMGIGFANYLLERRLEFVGSLLMSYKGRIKEAAALGGFQDYHHFSKAFKKYYGVSPADYIKSSKNK